MQTITTPKTDKIEIVTLDQLDDTDFDMSEIYHWFTTSGQSPLSCHRCCYISEHAQKPHESC